MINQQLAKEYSKIGVQTSVVNANAHKLIEMLLEGAIEKIAKAKNFMQVGNIKEKCIHVSMAITIIDGLQASLNHDEGGEIASNLHNLYDYMMRTLLMANYENNQEKLEEVMNLLNVIKNGWVGIKDEANEILDGKEDNEE